MRSAIETHELTKRFRKLRTYRDALAYPWRRPTLLAIDAVSLTIRRGEVFGVLGENGAGKTTLIRMLTTSLLPSSGTAAVGGYDVVREAGKVRSVIGLVGSDERSFFGELTGRQNLEFFAALQGLPPSTARGRIDPLLHRVGVAAAAERPFRTLSSGTRQKLAIVRGLLTDPEIVFLDEPTRSLDPISARSVRRLVSEFLVGELGRTVVLATHSLGEAEELCDRLALVRAGRVVAEGTVDELRSRLGHGLRCDLRVADMPPDLPDVLRRLPGVMAIEVGQNGGHSALGLVLEDDRSVLALVLRETIERGGEVVGCATREPTLEDVYVATLSEPSALEAAPC
ncbi:MAG TPA: ABC transporter ATP-binding protein [Gaiellaceae bacterium]|nr:ABC transporter ATP-binding protein [Gaiellaceae bacterium]